MQKQKEAEEAEEENQKWKVGKVSEGGRQFEGGAQTSVIEENKDSINLNLKFQRQVSDVMGILNYLQSKFDVLNIGFCKRRFYFRARIWR